LLDAAVILLLKIIGCCLIIKYYNLRS
jgi:hypothetical protein